MSVAPELNVTSVDSHQQLDTGVDSQPMLDTSVDSQPLLDASMRSQPLLDTTASVNSQPLPDASMDSQSLCHTTTSMDSQQQLDLNDVFSVGEETQYNSHLFDDLQLRPISDRLVRRIVEDGGGHVHVRRIVEDGGGHVHDDIVIGDIVITEVLVIKMSFKWQRKSHEVLRNQFCQSSEVSDVLTNVENKLQDMFFHIDVR